MSLICFRHLGQKKRIYGIEIEDEHLGRGVHHRFRVLKMHFSSFSVLSALIALLVSVDCSNSHSSHVDFISRAHHRHLGQLASVNSTDPSIDNRGSASNGWRSMPDLTLIAGATLDTSSLLVGDQGAVLSHYITSNYLVSQIKRAIIIVHGDDRESWNMQIYVTKALQRAMQGGDIRQEEVVIMAP